MNSYSKMFSLEVFHSYYADNICRGFLYKPDTKTLEIIQRYSCIQNSTNEGFELYSNTKNDFTNLLDYITKSTGVSSFTFQATTTQSLFYKFTDLPINSIGIVSYISNEIQSELSSNKIILKDKFITTKAANVVFEVTIRFEDLIQLYEKENTPNYQINFKARATQWKYYVINTTTKNYEKLTINSTTDIQFNVPEDVVLENGQKAQLFSLKNTVLPFSETPNYKFNLIATEEKNGITRNKILIKGLPNPSPNQIQVNTNKKDALIASLMYVYI